MWNLDGDGNDWMWCKYFWNDFYTFRIVACNYSKMLIKQLAAALDDIFIFSNQTKILN